MAHPYYASRSTHDPEPPRPMWDVLQRPQHPTFGSPMHRTMPSPNLFDPESESSDVSDDANEDPRNRGLPIYPVSIPPTPPKHTLESLDAVDARLRELTRVEDHNINRRETLKAKRHRKDEHIRRIREAQDVKIKAIMDARARRDDRINRRRKREDDAFERFDQELEEEEINLRRRQKRLKRGLPVEDSAMGSRISSASMSPPNNSYSSIPPPSKRHQTGPPGQNNSPIASGPPRPLSHSASSGPTSAAPNPPPYAFLQTSHPPPPSSATYGQSPTLSHSPSNPPGAFPPPPRSHQQQGQPSPYTVNGHPPSPQTTRPPPSAPSSILNTVPPPRPLTTYDTRPPPPALQQPQPQPAVASGFATINTPPASGFAPINPRATGTPPAPTSGPIVKSSDHDRMNGHPRPYASEGTPTASAASTSSKRTPSTTHPYQMSEAFANRHHHCERTDLLNRGIWTSFGPGGTKEIPTGPAQEMYLRCNHDGCRRIDWRTVHGLQCHIVKNHEQPKGTINSLEKALDRYGVPVAEIEAYEREHGDGTGGTMADPKNFKLKIKPGHLGDKSDAQRRSLGPQSHQTAYGSNLVSSLGNTGAPYHGSPASARSFPREDTEESEPERRITPTTLAAKPLQPTSRFASVNGAWSTLPATEPKPTETKDVLMKDAPPSPHSSTSVNVPKRDGAFWRNWPEGQNVPKPDTAPKVPSPHRGSNSLHGAPTSAPTQLAAGSANHNRSGSATTVANTASNSSTPSTPVHLVSKQSQASPREPNKQPHTPLAPLNQPKAVDSASASKLGPAMVAELRHPASKQASPPLREPPVPEKETIEVKDTPKLPEQSKIDVTEPVRNEPRSPVAVTRRGSMIGGRRESARRSSIAIRAEKEREKEREGALGATVATAAAAVAPMPTTPTKVSTEAAGTGLDMEREKERPANVEEDTRIPEREQQENDMGKDGAEGGDEESDDPDTIKVPSVNSKDMDKDDKETKTTPRRQPNGRFTRKSRQNF